MALLERVSTLLRANINDLLSKAEDPEKLARQLVLDMENQLVQVKTQVAIAIADQHLLQKKKAEQDALQAEWARKAEFAVSKKEDDMARAALERSLSHRRMAEGLAEQLADQTAETETLRGAYGRLQQKLTETQARIDLLMSQLRRSRAIEKAGTAQALLQNGTAQGSLKRLAGKVQEAETKSYVARGMLSVASAETLDERFASLEQENEIDALLLELKERQPRLEGGDGA
jgi:phage shock protein A